MTEDHLEDTEDARNPGMRSPDLKPLYDPRLQIVRWNELTEHRLDFARFPTVLGPG